MEAETQKRRLTKDQWLILVIIMALTAAAWAYNAWSVATGSMETDMKSAGMQGAADMAAAANAPAMPGFSMFVSMWTVMCMGMMLPTAIPMFFTFNTVSKRRSALGFANTPAFLFIAGYALLWVAIGFAFWGVGNIIIYFIGSAFTDWTRNTIGQGAVFAVAGAYQFSALKNACMKGCRHPLQFVMHNWRGGYAGSMGMGMRHGIECVGCCWALMAVMFPLGMMNLVWMGVLTFLMFVEKNASWGRLISKMAGVAFLAAGGAYIVLGIAGM